MKQKFDLIVVGGGILGTFHAYHALEAGKQVLLLEKDNYPVGATVRNFGQVVPSGMADEWFEYGVRGLEVYQAIQQQADISVRNQGSVYIASDVDEQRLLRELETHYRQVGYEAHLLSKKQVLQKYPVIKASYAKEGLFFPRELSVEPDRMIHNLHAYMKLRHASFQVAYNSPVIDCLDTAHGVEVVTAGGGRQLAEKVIICNGNEFKLLFPEIYSTSGQVVSKLQMMRTQPIQQAQLPGNVLTGLTIRRYESFERYCPSFAATPTPEHYRELKAWGIHILFKKAVDGSIILGDSHEYAEATQIDKLGFAINDKINQLMLSEASRIVDFDVRNISTTWAGFYPQHPNKGIVEIDVADNIHIRTAIGGKGMTASAGYTENSIKQLFNLY